MLPSNTGLRQSETGYQVLLRIAAPDDSPPATGVISLLANSVSIHPWGNHL
jgi:hypothetical protein